MLAGARKQVEEAAGYLPRDLVERFLNAGPEQAGDQRQVTLLFVDLAQSTEMVQALGGERMADLLDDLLDRIARAVNEVGGTVAELAGDGALCIFGAPNVHEDDPERALRAALTIQRLTAHLPVVQVADIEKQPMVRIGVHTGTVVLRVVGNAFRLGYAPVGDAVHLTQRLQTASIPGHILVSDVTRELTAALFHFDEPREVTLKGFDEPQTVFGLLGERSTAERRGLHASEATFVGRESDLAVVQAGIADLAAGIGGILTLWGEAGIGKSRLVAEVRRLAPDTLRWLEGRGLSYARNTAYSVIGQLVQHAAGITESDPDLVARAALHEMLVRVCGAEEATADYPVLAAAIGMKPGPDDGPALPSSSSEAIQTEIFRVLRSVLTRTTEQSALIVVFEDLQWSDRASIAALDSLIPLAEELPILFVLVARPDTDAPSWAVRQKIETLYGHLHTDVSLGPLSQQASSDLAMRLLQTDHLPADLRELVLVKAEGVPLFVEELTRSLLEQGALRREGDGWRLTVSSQDLRIPATVQGIILARLDRLSPELKAVLQAAAVLGPTVVQPVLARTLAADDRLAGQLRDLQRLGFLRRTRRQPETGYVFKHALIRDVAYQNLRQRSRRELHAKAGAAMELVFSDRLTEYHSIIAEHFVRAEVWAKAADYLLLAGDESTRLHAHVEARLHYGMASDALPHLPHSVDNRRRRVDTIVKRAAVSYIAEAPEVNLSRLAEGEELVSLLTDGDSPGDGVADRIRLAWIHYWTGRVHYVRGDPLQAMTYYAQALAVGEEFGDPRLVAGASALMGGAYVNRGDWAQAKRLLEQAVPLLEAAAVWREWCLSCGYLAVAVAACGEYDRAVALAQQGLDRARALRGWNMIAVTFTLISGTHLTNERMADLAEAAQQAIEAGDRAREPVVRYLGLGFLSWAQARLGDPVAALASMEASQKIGAGLGQLILADWFAVARAEIALCSGKFDQAAVLAEEAVTVAHQASGLFSGGLAHRVWARALATASPPQWAEARKHLEISLELLEAGNGRLPAAHTRMVYGAICRDSEDYVEALRQYQLAADQFEASGLAAELDWARDCIADVQWRSHSDSAKEQRSHCEPP